MWNRIKAGSLPGRTLSRLFFVQNETVVLSPAACKFITFMLSKGYCNNEWFTFVKPAFVNKREKYFLKRYIATFFRFWLAPWIPQQRIFLDFFRLIVWHNSWIFLFRIIWWLWYDFISFPGFIMSILFKVECPQTINVIHTLFQNENNRFGICAGAYNHLHKYINEKQVLASLVKVVTKEIV